MQVPLTYRGRSTESLVVAAFVICLTLFFVNELRMYDKAAGQRVAQERQHYRKALSNLFERDAGNSLCGPSRVELPAAPTFVGLSSKVPLVVLCYNRKEYLTRTFESIRKYVPLDNFPIIISQDGDAPGMAEFIRKSFPEAIHLQHWPRAAEPPASASRGLLSYYYISEHYRFALTRVFDVMKYDQAVLLEDDMDIAPDFFSFFAAMVPVLQSDPTLLCVSAWNDNGMEGIASNPVETRRTSFFPGLGWMLTRNLWAELKPKWPRGFWDDWLREPQQRKGRDCIHPQVSRTRTFGRDGSSSGQFYDSYLVRVVLNSEPVDWSQHSFAHLRKDVWTHQLMSRVATARTVAEDALEGAMPPTADGDDIRIFFDGEKRFQRIAGRLGLMPDLKAGVPRSAYEGVVTVPRGDGSALFIVDVALVGTYNITAD